MLRKDWVGPPGWLQALIVYLGCQTITFAMMLWWAHRSMPVLGKATYLDWLSRWDATWYSSLANNGYPDQLPVDTAGRIEQNGWAFYPVFPLMSRLVMSVTGWSFSAAGLLVVLLAAGAAAVVLYELILPNGGHRMALWVVAAVAALPAAPSLQIPYSDSLGLLVVVLTLWCLDRRRYYWASILLLVAGYTRPIVIPLAAVVILHVGREMWRTYRCHELTRAKVLPVLSLLVSSVFATVAWPLTVGLYTGKITVYTQTMQAWRQGRPIKPLVSWWDSKNAMLTPGGPKAALVLLLAGIIFALLCRACLTADLQWWVVFYLGYLLAVLDPSPSLYRYLILAFPLLVLIMNWLRRDRYRSAWLAGSFMLQWWWIGAIWVSPLWAP